MELHPLCKAFPRLSDNDLEALAADIEYNGLIHAIVTFEGQILDGGNRYKACQIAGVKPRFVDFTEFKGFEGDPVAFVRSSNKERRHLTSGQWAAVAVELEDYRRERELVAKRQDEGRKSGGQGNKKTFPNDLERVYEKNSRESINKIANLYGTNREYIFHAAKLKRFHPDLHEQVKQGEKTLPKAKQEAKNRERAIKEEWRKGIIAKSTPAVQYETNIQVQIGDIWALGDHILYCCNSSNWQPITEARMAFADPPYNAKVADWDYEFTWLHDWLEDAADFVWITPGLTNLHSFMRVTKMQYVTEYLYHQNNGIAKCNDWGMSNINAILLFSKLKPLKLERFSNFRSEPVNLAENKATRHPGRKPHGLVLWLIEICTNEGDLVIDPFLGSGTTLLVAEASGRVCHGCEINPEYCDEIIQRWQAATGKKATKIESNYHLNVV